MRFGAEQGNGGSTAVWLGAQAAPRFGAGRASCEEHQHGYWMRTRLGISNVVPARKPYDDPDPTSLPRDEMHTQRGTLSTGHNLPTVTCAGMRLAQ